MSVICLNKTKRSVHLRKYEFKTEIVSTVTNNRSKTLFVYRNTLILLYIHTHRPSSQTSSLYLGVYG